MIHENSYCYYYQIYYVNIKYIILVNLFIKLIFLIQINSNILLFNNNIGVYCQYYYS